MKLIGLVGYAQSGKDAAAEVLAPLGWKRVAFADGVREALYALNPYVVWWDQGPGKKITARLREIVDGCGWEGAKKIVEVRELLQRMGTEAGRDIHGPDLWITLAKKKAACSTKVVVTDVRFGNEAEAIRSGGGVLVRVRRPGVGAVNGHVSDRGIESISCDYELVNDGDKDAWREKVLAFFQNF